jgi:hypothetical protein
MPRVLYHEPHARLYRGGFWRFRFRRRWLGGAGSAALATPGPVASVCFTNSVSIVLRMEPPTVIKATAISTDMSEVVRIHSTE